MDGKSSDVLSVKCRLEDGAFFETRLLLLHRLHLSELHCRLGWLFNLSGHYQLKYLDKFGDLITFSSEEEFQLALANYLQPEFRLLITPIEPLQWQPPPRPGKKRAAFAVNGEHFVNREPAERPLIEPESKAPPLPQPPPSPPPPPPPSRYPPPPPSPPQHGGDWEAMFHPDYLRPRTATSRRSRFADGSGGGPRRVNAQRVQASLAGYPSDVATWASASESASVLEYSERPQRLRQPQLQQQHQQQPKSPVGSGFVHYGIECCRCGADPLVGWRFKCSSCPNYNLCARCFDCYSHGHGFYRLP